jgi:hypothetical protein
MPPTTLDLTQGFFFSVKKSGKKIGAWAVRSPLEKPGKPALSDLFSYFLAQKIIAVAMRK